MTENLRFGSAQIIDAAVDAAIEAWIPWYEDDSFLETVSQRNEAWTQSHVAFRINDRARDIYCDPQGIYVTVEARASWMPACVWDGLADSLPCDSSDWKGGEKFDVAVWGNDNFLIGLIEIKDAPGQDENAFGKDALRLKRAIKEWGPA